MPRIFDGQAYYDQHIRPFVLMHGEHNGPLFRLTPSESEFGRSLPAARSLILAALNQRVLDLIDAEIAAVRALRRDIDAGLADLEHGRVHEGEAVFEALLKEPTDEPS